MLKAICFQHSAICFFIFYSLNTEFFKKWLKQKSQKIWLFPFRKSHRNPLLHSSPLHLLLLLHLPIIGLCELGNCPQTTGCGVLRGTARPRVGANINLGCFYLVGTPVAVGLGFYAGFDFQGLWLGLLAAQASCVVTMLVVLNRTDWELDRSSASLLLTHLFNSPIFIYF